MPRPDAALARLAEQATPHLAAHHRQLQALASASAPPEAERGHGLSVAVHRAEQLDPDTLEPDEGAPEPDDQRADPPPPAATADVYVFEQIGGWGGCTADDFVRDVATLDVEHIDLHLNSPGGDVFEAAAMANVLRQHRATVTVWVDGIAASAASAIAMAGDEIVMGVGSQLMIHDAWTFAYGNAGDLRKQADVLDSVSNTIAETYAARAGGTREAWREAMLVESWYTPSEAVTAGLADRVATDADRGRATGQQVTPGAATWSWDAWDSLGAADRHDLSVFAHAGRAAAPAPPMPNQVRAHHAPAGPTRPPAPAGSSTTPTTGRSAVVDFPDEQVAPLRAQLGLADDADGAAILAALTDRLTQTPSAGSGDLVATLRDQVARQEAQLSTLTTERNARVKNDFFAEQARRGAMEPTERAALETAYDAAPDTIRALLSARANNSRVPVNAIGYTGDTASSSSAAESDDDYYALYPESRPAEPRSA